MQYKGLIHDAASAAISSEVMSILRRAERILQRYQQEAASGEPLAEEWRKRLDWDLMSVRASMEQACGLISGKIPWKKRGESHAQKIVGLHFGDCQPGPTPPAGGAPAAPETSPKVGGGESQ